jgi:hypothetical protein
LAHIAQELAQQRATAMFGRLRVTEANFACRSVYRRNGFAPVDHDPQLWSRSLALPFPMPAHVCFGARRAAA